MTSATWALLCAFWLGFLADNFYTARKATRGDKIAYLLITSVIWILVAEATG
jgi:hypothetical protein